MSNNKQQTAVEFYAEEFAEHLKENYGIKITNLTLLKQAKEMEKEQHVKSWEAGLMKVDFNEYYNETYGGNK